MSGTTITVEFAGQKEIVKAGADGKWTLEFGRKLTTGSEKDVQFSDLAAVYYFAVAAFDNAQVRHALTFDALKLVFAK